MSEDLVTANMRLVHYLVARNRDVDPAEALSLGQQGLMDAARDFDPSRGIPFGTYASYRIKWAIGVARQRRRTVKRGGRNVILSIDAPLDESGKSYVDLIPDDSIKEHSDREDEYRLLDEMLASLPERTQQILRLRFGEGHTLEMIAQKFGLSRERIRQVESQALASLQSWRSKEKGISGAMKKISRSKTDQANQTLLRRKFRP